MGLFDFFKKKKKNMVEEPKKPSKIYYPEFGSFLDLQKLYPGNESHVVIGKCSDQSINLNFGKNSGETIQIINDDQFSITHQCVVPIVTQGKLSYVIYDPDGSYYDALADRMRTIKYDVQLVDLADPQHRSRIDLFEIANITKNAYWVALMIAGSIKCNASEIKVSHNLLMGMLQYLMFKNKRATIEELYPLFVAIKNNDEQRVALIKNCVDSKQYMEQYYLASEEVRKSVIDKIDNLFFKIVFPKAKDPNIFTVMAHQKKTVLFIKSVPTKYKSLLTILLFNLKNANVLCGHGEMSTLIINSNNQWYNEPLLAKACSEAGAIANKGTATLYIADKYDAAVQADIIAYMQSKDQNTQNAIYDMIKLKNYPEADKMDIASAKFKGEPIPDESLEAAPISMNTFLEIAGCILIDTKKRVRPVQCDRLA